MSPKRKPTKIYEAIHKCLLCNQLIITTTELALEKLEEENNNRLDGDPMGYTGTHNCSDNGHGMTLFAGYLPKDGK